MATSSVDSRGAAGPSRREIVRALSDIYRGPAWHGPSLRATLRGVTGIEAGWRPAPNRNSIYDIVLHLAYARHRMLGRLAAFERRRHPRFGRSMRAGWFPYTPTHPDERGWTEDLRVLDSYQEQVLRAVGQAKPTTLAMRRRGKLVTIGSEFMGLAFHDAYHAGQIRLLTLLARH
ncbi:MAG: DinB family protein [Gemmatimonadaceae bacterium]